MPVGSPEPRPRRRAALRTGVGIGARFCCGIPAPGALGDGSLLPRLGPSSAAGALAVLSAPEGSDRWSRIGTITPVMSSFGGGL